MQSQGGVAKYLFLMDALAFPVPNDDFTCNAQAAANVAKFAITMSRLMQIHEIHVNRCPPICAPNCVCKCSSGLCNAFKPAIHILAGENVASSDNAGIPRQLKRRDKRR